MTNITDINIVKLAATVRKLAADNPDTTRACSYLAEDSAGIEQPHCIVGCAFAEHGISTQQLLDAEGRGVRELLQNQELSNDEANLVEWISGVQLRQDRGLTWSEAIA
jgi:hypothetical protein